MAVHINVSNQNYRWPVSSDTWKFSAVLIVSNGDPLALQMKYVPLQFSCGLASHGIGI